MRLRVGACITSVDGMPSERRQGSLGSAASTAYDVASATSTVASAVFGRVGSLVQAALGDQDSANGAPAQKGRRRVKQACGPSFLSCFDDRDDGCEPSRSSRPLNAAQSHRHKADDVGFAEPSEDVLTRVSRPGGSLEDKLGMLGGHFHDRARRLESMLQEFRSQAGDSASCEEASPEYPREVLDVVVEGMYTDPFLDAFDGQQFRIHSEQIVPGHAYCLSLEVHSGGAYWKGVSNSDDVRHPVATLGLSSSLSDVNPMGSAQRGAMFVWRWQRVDSEGALDKLPAWFNRLLRADGDDPVQKVHAEHDAVQRWHAQLDSDTGDIIKKRVLDLQDPYIREVLRLWPVEPREDAQSTIGGQQLKKRAWVEGLPPEYFCGKSVVVHRANYDAEGSHCLILKATISQAEALKEGEAPYRLATTWQWASANSYVAMPARVPPLPLGTYKASANSPGSTDVSGGGLYSGYSSSATSTERAAIAGQRAGDGDSRPLDVEDAVQRARLGIPMPISAVIAATTLSDMPGPEGDSLSNTSGQEDLLQQSERGTWRSALLEPMDIEVLSNLSRDGTQQATRGTWRSAILEPVDDDDGAMGDVGIAGPGIGSDTGVLVGAGVVRQTWRSAVLEPEDVHSSTAAPAAIR